MSDFVGYIASDGSVFEGDFTSEGGVGPIGPQGPQGEKGEKGDQGIQGPKGDDGYTPVKGTDYFTAAEISEIEGDVATTVLAQAYVKPVGGIPSTDMTNAVQTSLGKADTALQSFTETDPTVPSHVKNIKQTDIYSWNLKQKYIVTPLTTTIDLVDGSDTSLDEGLYFSVEYQVRLNNGATVAINQETFFRVDKPFDNYTLIGSYITYDNIDSMVMVGVEYGGGEWTLTQHKYYTDQDNIETQNNKVTSITSSSTNTQYPSAKAVYNLNAQKYTKPVGGIPKTDLTSSLQITIDSAVQPNDLTPYVKSENLIPITTAEINALFE